MNISTETFGDPCLNVDPECVLKKRVKVSYSQCMFYLEQKLGLLIVITYDNYYYCI